MTYTAWDLGPFAKVESVDGCRFHLGVSMERRASSLTDAGLIKIAFQAVPARAHKVRMKKRRHSVDSVRGQGGESIVVWEHARCGAEADLNTDADLLCCEPGRTSADRSDRDGRTRLRTFLQGQCRHQGQGHQDGAR